MIRSQINAKVGILFRITTWSESHGSAVSVVPDGCPAGLAPAAEDIQKELDRKRPGQRRASTARQDAIREEIGSGYGHLGKSHEHDITPRIAKALKA